MISNLSTPKFRVSKQMLEKIPLVSPLKNYPRILPYKGITHPCPPPNQNSLHHHFMRKAGNDPKTLFSMSKNCTLWVMTHCVQPYMVITPVHPESRSMEPIIQQTSIKQDQEHRLEVPLGFHRYTCEVILLLEESLSMDNVFYGILPDTDLIVSLSAALWLA